MVRLELKDSDDHIWVNPEYVIAIGQARAQSNVGPPLPVMGVSIVTILGAPPMAVAGTPQEVADKIEGAANGKSLLAN